MQITIWILLTMEDVQTTNTQTQLYGLNCTVLVTDSLFSL